jgi:hypothetical protein
MEKKKETIGLHTRMSLIKMELSKCKIPKSGHNKFSGFHYHELTDFMPFINELNVKHGVNAYPKFLKNEGICVLTLINSDDKEDFYDVIIPYVDAEMLSKGGGASVVDAIQRLGSTITYNRRYLYQSAYDIVESDGVDSLPPNEPQKQATQPEAKPVKVAKTECDDKTFETIKQAIIDGKRTIEQAKEKFIFTGTQNIELLNLKK